MLFGKYEYKYGPNGVPVSITKTIRAGYCPEWYYDKKKVLRHQDTESYARLLEKGSDAKETDDLKKKAINELGSKIFEKVIQKMKTHEGFFSPKNQGKKTLYDRDGKVIRLNELDKNLLKDVIPEESTKIAYANGVYSDMPDEAIRSAVHAARHLKAQDAVKLPETEEYDALDGDTERSEEKLNENVDAGLSRKRLPAYFGTDGKTSFFEDPGNPVQHALAAMGLTSNDVQLTPMAAGNGNSTLGSFYISDKDTSAKIGSCEITPNGCEIIDDDTKVVVNRLSDSDVSVERYAKDAEGNFELLGMSRISENDGITTRRPFMG